MATGFEFEMRPVHEDEVKTWVKTVEAGFGGTPTDEEAEDWLGTFERERSIAVFDGSVIVGTAGAFTFDMTVPGGTAIPAAGVTAVTVAPTHRRRGILRAMMEHQLDDVAARGEPVAILTASESVIYGRFGYGLASYGATYELPCEGTELRRPPACGGRIRLVDGEEAKKIFPGIWEAARLAQPGCLSRSAAWWEHHLKDVPRWRNGASALFHAVHESDDGEPDGYVLYRRKGDWTNGLPTGEVRVIEMTTPDEEVGAAQWRFCLDIDLVRTVKAFDMPVDAAIRHRLTDPRRLQVRRLHDFLWVRPLDVPAALGARRYATEDRITIEVTDAFRPATAGTYTVEGGSDGAECERGGQADLVMDVADLGAVYLGGERPSVLARAGRVQERTPGALQRADSFFASDRAPFCATHF